MLNLLKTTFLGATGTTSGSCYRIEARTKDGFETLIIDAGMFQGCLDKKLFNWLPYPFDIKKEKNILLTHAHADHCGMIPKLVKDGFSGNVICTKPTYDLCKIVLPDCGHIQEADCAKISKRKGSWIPPLYTVNDAITSLNYFNSIDYGEVIEISNSMRARFSSAGHILGSAIIELWITTVDNTETKLVFTGDLGRKNILFPGPSTIADADYLFMESTYGGKKHKNKNSFDLGEVMHQSISSGGNVVFVSFANGRPVHLLDEILQVINRIKELRNTPIYLDSPMAIKALNTYMENQDYLSCDVRALTESLPNLKLIKKAEQSIALNRMKGNIIISASGMADAGRVVHHIKNNAPDPNSAIIFSGYQAEGTRGRIILDGAEHLWYGKNRIEINAPAYQFETLSAHADQPGLLNWLAGFQSLPKAIFTVHGNSERTNRLIKAIRDNFEAPVYKPKLWHTYGLGNNGKASAPLVTSMDLILETIKQKPNTEIQMIIWALTNLVEYLEDNQSITFYEAQTIRNKYIKMAKKFLASKQNPKREKTCMRGRYRIA